MEIVSWDDLLQNLNGLWNLATVGFELDIMQKQVEDVPGSFVSPETADIVFWVVFVGVSWASVGLESFLISQDFQFSSDGIISSLKFTNPGELFSLPPTSKREIRNQIRASKLPWMIVLGQLVSINSHEEPSP